MHYDAARIGGWNTVWKIPGLFFAIHQYFIFALLLRVRRDAGFQYIQGGR